MLRNLKNIIRFKGYGDEIVGKWKSITSGTIIDCYKNGTNNNAFICAFNGYQAKVTWGADVFIWEHFNDVNGTITSNVLTWSYGTMWEKQNMTTGEERIQKSFYHIF